MNFERRAVLCFAVFCAALIPVLGFGASGETAASSSALDRGYHDAYNLDFTSAQREFAGWEREHPSDPVAPVSEAAGILFGELDRLGVLETQFYRLGVLESQFYENDDAFSGRSTFAADPAAKNRFTNALSRAETLARARLAKNPKDSDALFAMTLSSGLQADYAALIEKRNMASLGYTRDATTWAHKLLTQTPDYYDAYLATGVSNYIIGSLAAPVRWLLRLGGYQGDKKQGMHEVEITAAHGHYLAPFARLLLAIAYLRQNDQTKARELLAGLRDQFPANPLFSHEIALIDQASSQANSSKH